MLIRQNPRPKLLKIYGLYEVQKCVTLISTIISAFCVNQYKICRALCQIQKLQKPFFCYIIIDQHSSWSHVLDKAQQLLTWQHNGISFHLNEFYIIYHFWTRKRLCPFPLYFLTSVWINPCIKCETFPACFSVMELVVNVTNKRENVLRRLNNIFEWWNLEWFPLAGNFP